MNSEAILAVREIQKMIRVRWMDDSYYDDVLAFDPESDTPQPEAEEKIRKMMGQMADQMGLAPDMAHAIRKTGLVVAERSKHLLDAAQLAAWNEAIDEYIKLLKRPQ